MFQGAKSRLMGLIARRLLLILACLGGQLGFAMAEEEFPDEIILTTQEWPPYIVDEAGRPGGLSMVALDCAFKKIGRRYRVDFLPWKRAQFEVRSGRAHGFFPASGNRERASYATLSKPLVYNTWAWFMRKDSLLSPEAPSFKSEARVTSEAGSNLLFWLQDNGYNVTLAPDTHGQLGVMLILKRIDAALVTVAVFEDQLRARNIDIGQFRRYFVKEDPLGVYFSHAFLEDHPEFLSKLDKALEECR